MPFFLARQVVAADRWRQSTSFQYQMQAKLTAVHMRSTDSVE
jgi:hypothetical protein